jgi:hypothetical protein
MPAQPPKRPPQPGYAIATGVPGRAVTYHWPPEAIEELKALAKRYGIPQLGYTITADTITETK